MATDHRGRIVGNPMTDHGGHKPTRRLPIWGGRSYSAIRDMLGNYGLSEDESHDAIYMAKQNLHDRDGDSPMSYLYKMPGHPDEPSEFVRPEEMIMDAFRNRHKKGGGGPKESPVYD